MTENQSYPPPLRYVRVVFLVASGAVAAFGFVVMVVSLPGVVREVSGSVQWVFDLAFGLGTGAGSDPVLAFFIGALIALAGTTGVMLLVVEWDD